MKRSCITAILALSCAPIAKPSSPQALAPAPPRSPVPQALAPAPPRSPVPQALAPAPPRSPVPQALALYASVVLLDHPVAYWHLGEPSGLTATDSAGSYDGRYVGSPLQGRLGLIINWSDTCPRLDGVDDRITANSLASGVDWSHGFTLEAWVRVRQRTVEEHLMSFNLSDGGNGPAILRDEPTDRFKYRDGDGTMQPFLDFALPVVGILAIAVSVLATASLVIRFRRGAGDERQQIRWLAYVAAISVALFAATLLSSIGLQARGHEAFSTTIPRVRRRYYVVVAVNGSGGGALYVNGAKQATFTTPARPPSSGGLFTIGAEYDLGPTPESFWHGRIDEVAVYNHALSPTRVTAHWLAGRFGT
jgi:hypothetical protein